jgi:hypothetical protein
MARSVAETRKQDKGASLAMSCAECGSKIPPHYVVCEICGEPVAKEGSKAPARQDHPGYEVTAPAAKPKADEKPGADPSETVWSTVLGKDGKARAVILFDGAVCLMDGTTVGFVNTQLQVAASDGHLLGYVLGDQICDSSDVEVGYMNRGTGTLHDRLGSTLLDMDGIGCCRGQTSVILGQFEGLGYRELPQIALYALFLDPDFCDESADNVTREPRVEAVVAKAQATKRTDFVRAAKLDAGTGDRVTVELLEQGDVATMEFSARMALWAGQEKQKRLSLQPSAVPVAAEAKPAIKAATVAAPAVAKAAPKAAVAAAKAAPKAVAAAPAKAAAAAAAPAKVRYCGECGSKVEAGRAECSVCGEPCP